MQQLNDEQSIRVRGDIVIVERNIETGEVVKEETQNVVLNQGKKILIDGISKNTAGQNIIKTLKIGRDVGTGTIMQPQDATSDLTEATLEEVYTTPEAEFSVSYPTNNSVRFTSILNGINVMNQHPNQPNVIYTSATLVTSNGKSVTYKRFPARTISSLISVEITWTLTLE